MFRALVWNGVVSDTCCIPIPHVSPLNPEQEQHVRISTGSDPTLLRPPGSCCSYL